MNNPTKISSAMVYRGAFIGTCAMLAMGCVGRSITELADLPLARTSLAAVEALPSASIIAVGGTQQLTTRNTDFNGAAVTLDSLVYQYVTPSDSLLLRLSRSGLVTGVATGAVAINVIGFKNGAMRGDQVVVQVTSTSQSGLALSIQPVAPDSARLAVGTTKTLVPVLRNPSTGASVANPAVIYEVRGSDSTRLDVYRGTVQYAVNSSLNFIVRPATTNFLNRNQFVPLSGEGTAWIYATINAYGTELKDSVLFTFTYPFSSTIATTKANLAVVSNMAGQTIKLAPGATVTFQNGVGGTDPLTVAYTFDNAAAATAASPASTTGGASGNVSALTGGQASRRTFLTPGTYVWTATAGGQAPWSGQMISGQIIIK